MRKIYQKIKNCVNKVKFKFIYEMLDCDNVRNNKRRKLCYQIFFIRAENGAFFCKQYTKKVFV